MQVLHTCQSAGLGALSAGTHLAPQRTRAAPSQPPSRMGCRRGAARCQAEGSSVSGPASAGNGTLVAGEYGEAIVRSGPAGGEDEVKLECDESGCVFIVGKNVPGLEEEKSAGYLQCNLTGCFYSSSPAAGEFQVLEGAGWRLGYETAPTSEDSLSAMVGAGGWSISLTASEFHDFCKLIQMLRKGIITMGKDGVLGRDDIVMQVEKGSMWMECVVPKKGLPSLQRFLQFGGRADQSAFEIRFILTGKHDKRQAEGYWPADAVMDMLRKVDELSLSGARAQGVQEEANKPQQVVKA